MWHKIESNIPDGTRNRFGDFISEPIEVCGKNNERAIVQLELLVMYGRVDEGVVTPYSIDYRWEITNVQYWDDAVLTFVPIWWRAIDKLPEEI